MNYQQQAIEFAKKHKITLKVLGTTYGKHFEGDPIERYIFKMQLRRNKKTYTFNFGQSIAEGDKEPDMYSVLACLIKNDPYSFEDFCSDYGYDEDLRSSEKVYKAVVKEWEAVDRLFNDILDELQEIA